MSGTWYRVAVLGARRCGKTQLIAQLTGQAYRAIGLDLTVLDYTTDPKHRDKLTFRDFSFEPALQGGHANFYRDNDIYLYCIDTRQAPVRGEIDHFMQCMSLYLTGRHSGRLVVALNFEDIQPNHAQAWETAIRDTQSFIDIEQYAGPVSFVRVSATQGDNCQKLEHILIGRAREAKQGGYVDRHNHKNRLSPRYVCKNLDDPLFLDQLFQPEPLNPGSKETVLPIYKVLRKAWWWQRSELLSHPGIISRLQRKDSFNEACANALQRLTNSTYERWTQQQHRCTALHCFGFLSPRRTGDKLAALRAFNQQIESANNFNSVCKTVTELITKPILTKHRRVGLFRFGFLGRKSRFHKWLSRADLRLNKLELSLSVDKNYRPRIKF